MGGRIIRSGRGGFTDGRKIRRGVIMTKKHFIKKAMSYGVQRNEANVLADQISNFESYDKLFAAMKLRFAVGEFVSNVARALAPVVKALKRVFT